MIEAHAIGKTDRIALNGEARVGRRVDDRRTVAIRIRGGKRADDARDDILIDRAAGQCHSTRSLLRRSCGRSESELVDAQMLAAVGLAGKLRDGCIIDEDRTGEGDGLQVTGLRSVTSRGRWIGERAVVVEAQIASQNRVADLQREGGAAVCLVEDADGDGVPAFGYAVLR
ncbi:hypothetical protein D3C71_742400 [compost metagenome]